MTVHSEFETAGNDMFESCYSCSAIVNYNCSAPQFGAIRLCLNGKQQGDIVGRKRFRLAIAEAARQNAPEKSSTVTDSLMISEHTSEWLGLPVSLFDAEQMKRGITDYKSRIYRVATEYDGPPFEEVFAAFIANPACAEAPAIVIGAVGSDGGQEMSTALELLVAAREKLKGLKGIFFGDMIVEESEISWITQTDVSPLFTAYPDLEHLRIRGGNELTLGGTVRHPKLKSLVIETGGLGANVVQQVVAADLPALEHLELWLGEENYGGDATMDDVLPLFEAGRFPNLKRLGICNSTFQDYVATVAATAPVLAQLEVLDLSLGTLSDTGASALLASEGVKRLKHLDLYHHYLSSAMMEKLKATFPSVDVSEQEKDNGDPEDRYVAHSE
jgi:hypothetical protein